MLDATTITRETSPLDITNVSLDSLIDTLFSQIMGMRGRIMKQQMEGYTSLSEEDAKKKSDTLSIEEMQLDVAQRHFDAFLKSQKAYDNYMKGKGRETNKQHELDAKEQLMNIKSSLPSLIQSVPTK